MYKDKFPSIPLKELIDYTNLIGNWAKGYADYRNQKDPGIYSKVYQNATRGIAAKTAAALFRGLNPVDCINYHFDTNDYATFIKTSNHTIDAFNTKILSFEDNIIEMSIMLLKYENIIKRISKGEYAEEVDLLYHQESKGNPFDSRYYHLGTFNVDTDFPEPDSLIEEKYIKFSMKIEGRLPCGVYKLNDLSNRR